VRVGAWDFDNMDSTTWTSDEQRDAMTRILFFVPCCRQPRRLR
jgi:hypothetical protein